ncbi:MAG: hypothetical protein ACRDTG_04800 [Pseudonocardiaceae bacterium]
MESDAARLIPPDGTAVRPDELWARFMDDPLASVSERFPLGWPGHAQPGEGGDPSTPDTRPFGLRVLRIMGTPALLKFRYCHERQLTIGSDDQELSAVVDKLDWTTVSHSDGDEGPAKDYARETVPDDDPE